MWQDIIQLSQADRNQRIPVGPNGRVISSAAVQMFAATYPPNSSSAWNKLHSGYVCVVKEFATRAAHIRLFSIDLKNQLWDQMINQSLSYNRVMSTFHVFISAKQRMIGLNFGDEHEATKFRENIQANQARRTATLAPKQSEAQLYNNQHQSTRVQTIGQKTGKVIEDESKSYTESGRENSRPNEHQKKKKAVPISKGDISVPIDFRHIHHLDKQTGFGVADAKNDRVTKQYIENASLTSVSSSGDTQGSLRRSTASKSATLMPGRVVLSAHLSQPMTSSSPPPPPPSANQQSPARPPPPVNHKSSQLRVIVSGSANCVIPPPPAPPTMFSSANQQSPAPHPPPPAANEKPPHLTALAAGWSNSVIPPPRPPPPANQQSPAPPPPPPPNQKPSHLTALATGGINSVISPPPPQLPPPPPLPINLRNGAGPITIRPPPLPRPAPASANQSEQQVTQKAPAPTARDMITSSALLAAKDKLRKIEEPVDTKATPEGSRPANSVRDMRTLISHQLDDRFRQMNNISDSDTESDSDWE